MVQIEPTQTNLVAVYRIVEHNLNVPTFRVPVVVVQDRVPDKRRQKRTPVCRPIGAASDVKILSYILAHHQRQDETITAVKGVGREERKDIGRHVKIWDTDEIQRTQWCKII
jgi:hypothetical protein